MDLQPEYGITAYDRKRPHRSVTDALSIVGGVICATSSSETHPESRALAPNNNYLSPWQMERRGDSDCIDKIAILCFQLDADSYRCHDRRSQ